MTRDISEDLPIDLSGTQATSTEIDNTGIEYDYLFGDQGFIDFSNSEHPYRRETAQYRKEQSDNSAEPGEQSLLGWWLRSQSSFHFGAGADFYEPAQDQNLRFKFDDSRNVDVFNVGKVTLLRSAAALPDTEIVSLAPKNNLRTVAAGVLVHDRHRIFTVSDDGTETDVVSYDTVTHEPAYAMCDDGTFVYWATNDAGKGQLWRKPISGGVAVRMYQHEQPTAGSMVMEYVKDRLVICSDNAVYIANVSPTTSDTTPALLYTQSNANFVFTGITQSPSDIFISGYTGDRSVIYRVYFKINDQTDLPEPATLLVVSEMPKGEIVHSVTHYLGYLVIGTSRGVRVAAVGGDGAVSYGPLLFETSHPVYAIAVDDRFAWVTATVDDNVGLYKIDLGTEISDLNFAYATNLYVSGQQEECRGVAFIGNTDRLAFCGENLYYESESELASSGWIRTGRIRFNTLEDKYFKYVRERAIYTGDYAGTIGVSADNVSLYLASASNGNKDIGIVRTDPAEYRSFTFTLNRDDASTSKGPLFYGYQIKALPATRRQRLIQYPLRCYDFDSDRNGNLFGYEGAAFRKLALFEALEESADIITIKNFRTGERFQALVEECSFVAEATSSRTNSNFGGLLTVTVRKI
jgi:hypothetical protein